MTCSLGLPLLPLGGEGSDGDLPFLTCCAGTRVSASTPAAAAQAVRDVIDAICPCWRHLGAAGEGELDNAAVIREIRRRAG